MTTCISHGGALDFSRTASQDVQCHRVAHASDGGFRLIAVAHALKISDRCCQKLPLKVLGRGGPQCWQSVYACESPYAQRRPPVKIGSCRSRRYPLMTASPETGRGAFA
jgi:hypothetical protein